MFNIDNIINAGNYEDLCDYSIIPTAGKFFDPAILNHDATIFCKTDFIEYLFTNIQQSQYCYTILTHHSDYPIDTARWRLKPKCIKKWLAINAVINHPDLIPIPLGLKTHKGAYLEKQYMTDWFVGEISRLKDNPKKLNIYCNWNTTNLERNKITETLKTNGINFTHDGTIPFNEYIERMSQHKFVISPPGNGIDCHRTWEALYVGCIPIVIQNRIYDHWNELPILQVPDYSSITEELLTDFMKRDYRYDMLSIDYWRNYTII